MKYPVVNDKLLEEIINKILEVGEPEKIILFGSQVTKKAKPESDIDILIVESSNLPRHKRAIKYRKALRGIYPSKDIIVWTPEEIDEWAEVPNAFINEVITQGLVKYEKSA